MQRREMGFRDFDVKYGVKTTSESPFENAHWTIDKSEAKRRLMKWRDKYGKKQWFRDNQKDIERFGLSRAWLESSEKEDAAWEVRPPWPVTAC